jgi:pimeloyl-ACP methyl ester carboxylesterase
MVPPDHGRWLAERIPGVEAHISEEDGHLTIFERRTPEIHEWLLGAFRT